MKRKLLFASFLFFATVCFVSCKKDNCEIPIAEFSLSASPFAVGDTIQLINNSTNATRFRWEISYVAATSSYFLENGDTVCFDVSPHVVLRDGIKVKLTAANECYESATFSSELLTGSWIAKENFGGPARGFAVGFSIGNKGYIGTGQISMSSLANDFWEWDQSTNVWSQKADFPGGDRQLAVGFSIGIKGYIGTGQDINGNLYNDFWEWDQSNNTWVQKANFAGSARSASVGFSIGSKGYIGTGMISQTMEANDFWEWDQTSDIWIAKAYFGGTPRGYGVGFSIASKGYVATGGTGVCERDLWEWDQLSNSWSQKADLPGNLLYVGYPGNPRNSASGFSIGGKGYIGTGCDGSGILSDFWEWDQATNSWLRKKDFGGNGRQYAVGFSIGTKGYFGTGINGNYCNDFWEFDPQ